MFVIFSVFSTICIPYFLLFSSIQYGALIAVPVVFRHEIFWNIPLVPYQYTGSAPVHVRTCTWYVRDILSKPYRYMHLRVVHALKLLTIHGKRGYILQVLHFASFHAAIICSRKLV